MTDTFYGTTTKAKQKERAFGPLMAPEVAPTQHREKVQMILHLLTPAGLVYQMFTPCFIYLFIVTDLCACLNCVLN